MNITFWTNINEVPKVFRQLEGCKLTVEQSNYIYKDLAVRHATARKDGRLDPDYATARKLFMSEHEIVKVGNLKVCIKKGGNA